MFAIGHDPKPAASTFHCHKLYRFKSILNVVISHLLLDFPKLPPSKRITHQNSVIVSCLIDLNCVASGRYLMVSDLHMKLVHEWYVLHTIYRGYKVTFRLRKPRF